jgi:2-keto-4-pentenoate hydratase/2-oxohepta-3-ene-1,7-dioic acid hydratase in catechol pathway
VTHYLPSPSRGFSLGRFRAPDGATFTGLVVEQRVRCLDRGAQSPHPVQLLASWAGSRDELSELADGPGGLWYGAEDLVPLAPLDPGQILQAGANYRKHVVDIVISELDDDSQGRTPAEKRAFAETMMDDRAATGDPYVFFGAPSAVCGPLDDIVLPVRPGAEHDWELELAVVIGRGGHRIGRAQAMEHVAGYTIVNDITSRDLVYRNDLPKLGTDWLAAKNSPTFLPTGPVIVPAEFVDDPMNLRVTLRHNGTVRQDESTADMIFDVARIIEYTSHRIALRAGDLILTGSPAGNGAAWGVFLRDGDVIEAEITGLGRQRNRCVDEPPPAAGETVATIAELTRS